MKLCVNYLEETKALIEEGKIDFIDYIKLFSINGDLSPIDWCVTKKDVMFHGIIGETGSNIADRNFFENSIKKQANRVAKLSNPSLKELQTLLSEDLF
jgi:hypothetical protein